MPRAACLTSEELNAFHLGELAEPTLVELADHLEHCPHCEAAARALDSVSDPVVAAYRQSALAGPPPTDAGLPGRVGEYEILAEVGRGGMGVVYQARHVRLQRTVALKMLLDGVFAHGEERARFRAEAEAVARLQHPHIVQIYEVGEHDAGAGLPRPYFTLEFAEGGNLAARLGGRSQPPQQAAAWVEALARAMHYAHQRGIVHRDLKPSNVLLTADGQPKVCDFGVAKFLAGADVKTLSGTVLGTAEYMAPEQAAGAAAVGPAADVYALGAILYTSLTGRPPFQGTSAWHTLEQVLRQEPVPPRRLQPGVTRDLDTICLKCLEKEPRKRYPSAEALGDDLQRFLDGKPVKARPVGPLGRSARWCRRNPLVAGALAAVAVTVVVAFAWINGEKNAAHALAEENARLAHQEGEARRRTQEALAHRTVALKERDAAARRAQAVNDYLIRDMLASADPHGSRGETLTVRAVLDRAAAGVERAFGGEPESEDVVREMLGRAYLSVGQPRDALAQLTARVTLCRRVRGEAHALTRAARAQRLSALVRCSHFTEALKESALLLPQLRQDHGNEGPLVLNLLEETAQAHRGLQQFTEARRIQEGVVAARRRIDGPEHEETLRALGDLAVILIESGRPQDAARLCAKGLPASRKLLGPDHMTTLLLRNQHAMSLMAQGRLAEAQKECEALLSVLRRTAGPAHLETLQVTNNLACVLLLRQRPAEACRLFEQCLPPMRRLLGEENAQVLNVAACHGSCLVQLGRFVEAEALYERLLPVQRRLLRPEATGRLEALARYGMVLQRQGKQARAEPVWRELLEARRQACPAGHWQIGEVEVLLGHCLAQQSRFKDAEPLLLAGHERLARAQSPPAPHATLRLAVAALVVLYEGKGNQEQAAAWRSRLPPAVAPPRK